MERLKEGMNVRTTYGTGPYRIVHIMTSTEPDFIESINSKNPKPSPEHYCLTVRRLDSKDKSDYYLNGYDENLNNVWRHNCRLIIESEETTLLNLIANYGI